MRFKIFLLLFLSISTYTHAQPGNGLAGYGIEVNPFFGKVLKHNYIFPPVPRQSFALDINILKQISGTKDWHVRRNYPLIGLGITYTDYGIDSVYGKCIGIYPVWEWPLVRGEKLEWTCRFGYGIGYVTRRFERYPAFDTVNNLIGSRLNNFTMFTTQLRYKVNHHLHLHMGFNYSHISNGSFRLPNLGVNMYGGHIGMRYFPVTDEPAQASNQPGQLNNRWMIQGRVGLSMIEYTMPDGPLYPVYMATLYVSKRYAGKNKILAGIDYSYYTALHAFMRNNEINPGEEGKYAWEGVIFAGHEFIMGKIGIIAQFGIPFRHSLVNKDWTVQKLGYCYYLLQHEQGVLKELTINAFVKSNNLEAANLEFSTGFGF